MHEKPVTSRDRGDETTETSAVREEYARLAHHYDERWAGYVAASVSATLDRLAPRPGERLLDVGCGTGVLLAAVRQTVPDIHVAGVDLATEMLRSARTKLGEDVPLFAADAARLPFPAGRFDAVVSSSSFHYWADPAAGLAEIGRVLGPGGRLVVTDWCDDFLACKVCDLVLGAMRSSHKGAYGTDECRRLLTRAGYVVTAIERYKIDWFWGLMTASAEWPNR